MKVFLKPLLQVLGAVVLSVFLVWKTDLGAIVTVLKQADLLSFLISTHTAVVLVMIHAAKLNVLLGETELKTPFWRLVEINLMARFWGLFVPTAVGQEAVRWWKVTRNGTGRVLFLGIILFERTVFVVATLLFAGIFLFRPGAPAAVAEFAGKVRPLVAGVLLGCAVVLAVLYGDSFRGGMAHLTQRLPRIGRPLAAVFRGVDPPTLSFSGWTAFSGLTVLWLLAFVFRLLHLFVAAGVRLSVPEAVWVSLAVVLLQMVPLSFGGIGVREGVLAYALATFGGVEPERGVAVGLLFFIQMLFLSGVGGVIEVRERLNLQKVFDAVE